MTEREPMQWTANVGPLAAQLVIGYAMPGLMVNGRDVTGTAAQLGDLATMLDGDGPIGRRAAAKIRRDVYETVVVVGLLNPVVGLQAIADLLVVLGPDAGAIPPALQERVDAYLRSRS